MNVVDKAKKTVEKLRKQLGKQPDNKGLHAVDKADHAKGGMKNAGENIKDAFDK